MRKHFLPGVFLVLATWLSNCTYASNSPFITIGSAASASQVRWTPDPRRGSASSTMSGGRRGTASATCVESGRSDESLDPTLTLLVPDGNTALTTQARPTLTWYLKSEQVANMEFVLYHPEYANPVYTRALEATTGLIEVSLPESAALEAGVSYRWTVFVDCKSSNSSIYTRSFVERTEVPIELDANAVSPLDQAAFYAAQGVWYDALNLLIGAYRQDAQPNTLTELRNLLQQGNADIPIEVSLAVES